MNNKFSFYDDVEGFERYLNFPVGALRNIPIYARKAAIDAILKVRDMEKASIFRPGLYYIVLADLCSNTAFNAKYGDEEGNVRIEWFQTAAIEAIGEISVRNYVAFSKTIGDASLLIFSSFQDVFEWSERFSQNLSGFSQEYPGNLTRRGILTNQTEESLDDMIQDFELRARRLVHLGEVSFKEYSDPLCLAVSQTFKIEKEFSKTDLGCTQAVADAVRPKLPTLGVQLYENRKVKIPGIENEVMTYYIKKQMNKTIL